MRWPIFRVRNVERQTTNTPPLPEQGWLADGDRLVCIFRLARLDDLRRGECRGRRRARIGTLEEIGQILMEADVIMDY